jgi:hypothetical protein
VSRQEQQVTDAAGDPVASVDAMVGAIHPGVSGPGIETGDTVLVTGPWLAGSTSIVAALRERMPEQTFTEELDVVDSPVAVVFVASGFGPVTDSDCALLDTAAANTDLVIGAVSKSDAHPGWRDVLATDRAVLSGHDPRYRDVAWVGVAAAPEAGEPVMDELVDVLRRGLADGDLARRNRLRAWETRLRGAVRRHDDDAAGLGREARVAALREERREMLGRRQTNSERTAELRSHLRQAQEQLVSFARNRCTSVHGELQEDASGMSPQRLASFEGYVRRRVNEVVAEVDGGATKQLGDVAAEFGLDAPDGGSVPHAPPVSSPPVSAPLLKSRRVWATMLLGGVLGAGVGSAVGWWLGWRLGWRFGFGSGFVTLAGVAAVGAVAGIGVAVSAVRIRRLRHDRSVLSRWAGDVIDELRAVVERHVGERVANAEGVLMAAKAERDDADGARIMERLAGIDAELREHDIAARRAATLRSRELPSLQRALAAVRAELGGSAADAPAPGTSAN